MSTRVSGLPLGLIGCVALAALTLIAPSQPTYDPWSWIVWGREVLHLDLVTTFGPSWKPLPVALTTVFALFGSAAPALWVLTARAGALAGALWAFRLGRRLGGPWAGAAAATALLVAPWFLRVGALADSEGMQVAFALAAIDFALAGRRGTAFALGIGLGLLRPEAWPFIGLYALWIVWRDRSTLLRVAGGLTLLPLLWLVPEKLGSGDWLRAAHRATDTISGTPAGSAHPILDVLQQGWAMLGGPTRWALVAALVLAAVRRDRRMLALMGLIAAWAGLVAVMTANGYSGNPRYLIVPVALALVLGAVAVSRIGRAPAAAVLVAAVVLHWAAPAQQTIAATSWQARMVGQLSALVARAGGPAAVKACGPVTTGAYLVPAVAWQLDLHLGDIALVPDPHGTTLRVHTMRDAVALPTMTPLAGAPVHTLARSADWRIATTC